MPYFLRKYPKSLLLIVLLALVVRIALFGGIFGSFGEDGLHLTDSRGFFRTGENIAAGNGFSRSSEAPFEPSAHFPPVYPLLVAGSLSVSDSIIPLIILQIILGSLIPILVFRLGSLITERKSVPLIAAGLSAFEPLGILWSVTLLTDTVSVFFLLLAAYFFLLAWRNTTWPDAALSAFFLGLSTLTRPHGQFLFYLAAFFFLALAVRALFIKKNFRSYYAPLTAFVLLFMLTMSPWLIRNYSQFGSFNISTTGLRNVYSSFATSIIALNTGRPHGEVQEELHQQFATKYGVQTRDISENPALGKTLAKEGLLIMRQYPLDTLKLIAIDANAFFTQDLYTTYLREYDVIPRFVMDFSPSVVLISDGPFVLAERIWDKLGALSIIPILGRSLWVALTLLAIGGFFITFKQRRTRAVALFLLLIILTYAATSMAAGFSDYGRHRFPANSFIFLLAALGASRLFQTNSQRVELLKSGQAGDK